MRRIWFMFKIFETILGLSCLGWNTRGILNITNIQDNYTHAAIFSAFTLMAMFGCIDICFKESVPPFREGCKNMIAAVSFIFVSVDCMYHAEKDFYLTYLKSDIKKEALEEMELSKPPYPFFKYSRAQSVAALCGGSLFLLHAILAFDFAIVSIEGMSSESEEDDEDDEYTEYLLFYVFSKQVHQWLNHFEWFHTLADAPITIHREEFIIREELAGNLN